MDFSTPARTRIAPSPTGDPHVGTAYMALFNRALADRSGGQFLFRLDDTDQARRQESSEQMLYDALKWLGIRYEEGPDIGGPHAPYRQSERLDRYWTYVKRLLDEGHAYYCFATSEELDTMRKIQQKEGRPSVYDRRWRDRDASEVQARLESGADYVVRVKMPLTGEVSFNDLLRGPIRFPASELDDKVIWKSDGFPTYHLANVVDDHEFGITHILRGEEWIASVPLHVVMIQALGFKMPTMLHMPLLRNDDKSKVSKRKNPTSLMWFRDAGFLPEGLLNFLGNMGYSLPNDQEVFSYQEFVANYDPEKIKLGGPVFDLKKLEWLNGEHMRALSDADLEARLIAYLESVKGRDFSALEASFRDNPDVIWSDSPDFNKSPFANKLRIQSLERCKQIAASAEGWLARSDVIAKLIPLLKTRLHTLAEAADYLPLFFEKLPALPLAELAGIKKFEKPEQLEVLTKVRELLEAADFADAELPAKMDASLREFHDSKGWKAGPVFMTIRLAVLRAKISPPLIESMQVLGRDVTLARLSDAMQQLG